MLIRQLICVVFFQQKKAKEDKMEKHDISPELDNISLEAGDIPVDERAYYFLYIEPNSEYKKLTCHEKPELVYMDYLYHCMGHGEIVLVGVQDVVECLNGENPVGSMVHRGFSCRIGVYQKGSSVIEVDGIIRIVL